MASDPKNSPPTSQRLSYWPGLIEHYRRFLPVTDSTPIVTLNEGNTPLIEAPEIADRLGLNVKVYFKFEGANPTGSFKDRGMTVAVSRAIDRGAHALRRAVGGGCQRAVAAALEQADDLVGEAVGAQAGVADLAAGVDQAVQDLGQPGVIGVGGVNGGYCSIH